MKKYLDNKKFKKIIKKYIFELYELYSLNGYRKYIDTSHMDLISNIWNDMKLEYYGVWNENNENIYAGPIEIMGIIVETNKHHYICLNGKPCINLAYWGDNEIKMNKELKRLKVI